MDFSEIILTLGLAGVTVAVSLGVRRAFRHPASRRSRRPRPSFAWRAGLIVLPVALLAVFALWSLRQDRLLAEQQARESAALAARQWAREFGRELTATWTQARDEQAAAQAAWRQVLGAGERVEGADPREVLRRAGLGQEQNPARPALQFSLDPAGWPSGIVPGAGTGQPAAWLLELSTAERTAWHTAQAALAIGRTNEAIRLLDVLLAGPATEELKANADFLKALLEAELAPPDEARQRLRAARQRFDRAPSETGYPLSQLAWLRALQRLPAATGLAEADLDAIVSFAETAASPLLASFVEQITRLVQPGHAADTAKVDALRRLVQTRLATAAAATNLVRQCPFATHRSTVCWFESGGTEYLAVTFARPASATAAGSADNHTATTVHLLERTLVEAAAARCAAATSGSVPRYARLTVTLGEREFLPESFEAPASALPAWPLLAEVAGSLDLQPRPADAPLPAFQVRVVLADAALLYAQQRRRAWLFGGLILAAAGTALVGLVAAHRAFERQLRLSEMKSNFVSSVSHELRAPVAAVRLLAESLERGTVTEETRRREYFRLISQECRRLSALIENVLDFARIEQGRKQYEFEPTDLPALVAQTVRLMEPYAAERQVTLLYEPPRNFNWQPVLDGRAIQQALVNLIDNAVKHSPAGAAVTVALAAPSDRGTAGSPTPDAAPRLTLAVADRGPGIPTAERARIFEPFYRRGSELRRETTGVGIGLSLVKHIVEAHGGQVRVESRLGKGSRFVIELPVHEPPPETAP
jgi:signal transduction histidine kinase